MFLPYHVDFDESQDMSWKELKKGPQVQHGTPQKTNKTQVIHLRKTPSAQVPILRDQISQMFIFCICIY